MKNNNVQKTANLVVTTSKLNTGNNTSTRSYSFPKETRPEIKEIFILKRLTLEGNGGGYKGL
jgi:hypothetical protein